MTLQTARYAMAAAAFVMAGCSTIEGQPTSNILIPGKALNVSPSLSIPAEGIAAGALLFLVVDPLAPNWRVSEEQLDARRFRIALKMKRYTYGGEGEAVQVFRRAAQRIAREYGYSDYAVVEFNEGIDSSVLLAQRVAHGVIEMRR